MSVLPADRFDFARSVSPELGIRLHKLSTAEWFTEAATFPLQG